MGNKSTGVHELYDRRVSAVQHEVEGALGVSDVPGQPKAWYESLWATILTGYAFAPVGLYLMWRYQPWPVWRKAGLTVFGLTMWVVGTYVSSRYVMPRLF